MGVDVDIADIPHSDPPGLRIPDQLQPLEVLDDLLVLDKHLADRVSKQVDSSVRAEETQEYR